MARLLSAKLRPVRIQLSRLELFLDLLCAAILIGTETKSYTHATIALGGAMFLVLNKTPGWHTMGAEQPALL